MILISLSEFSGTTLGIFLFSFLFLVMVGMAEIVVREWIELFKLAEGGTVDPDRKFRGGPMKRIPPLFIDKCDKYCDLCGCVIPDPDNIHVSPYCLNCLRGA